jgi:hypothetical protein
VFEYFKKKMEEPYLSVDTPERAKKFIKVPPIQRSRRKKRISPSLFGYLVTKDPESRGMFSEIGSFINVPFHVDFQDVRNILGVEKLAIPIRCGRFLCYYGERTGDVNNGASNLARDLGTEAVICGNALFLGPPAPGGRCGQGFTREKKSLLPSAARK